MRTRVVTAGLLALLTAIALASVSPAPASVLCAANESGCPAEKAVEKNDLVSVTATKTVITTSTTNITCKGGGGSFLINDVGGEGKIAQGFTFGLGLGECQAATEFPCFDEGSPISGSTKFEGSGGSGTVVIAGSSGLKIQCTFPAFTCTFSASGIGYAFSGGTPATMVKENLILSRSGILCPATASLHSEWKVTSPSSLFIVGGPAPGPVARLCNDDFAPCPISERHPVGAALEGELEGNSSFEFLYEGLLREPACESGSISGKTTEPGKPLVGEVSALSFSKCGGGVCAAQAQGLAYKAEIEKTTGGNGTLTLATGTGGTPKIEVNCGKSFQCVYKAGGVSFAVTGGNPAKLAVSQTLEKDAASEAECGSTMTWKATYKLTKPTPLYVTS